jgi:tRNA (mo5U34)-methyltransferase
MTPEEIRLRVAQVAPWWHSIELAPGVVTPGQKTAEILRGEVAAMRLDDLDLRGKSVIDIGAWDGFFSFEAERRGARSVLAFDHFVWSVDLAKALAYRTSCQERGVPVEPFEEVPGLWCPDTLPGKRGFDLARELLGSRVESRVGDLMTADLDALGRFDVSFYLGVLYHLRNPLEGLTRLAAITREVAIIETHAILIPGREGRALCEFFEGSGLNDDASNWWVPNETALIGLCRAAGFRKVERVSEKPAEPPPRERSILQRLRGREHKPPRDPIYYRATVHAWK